MRGPDRRTEGLFSYVSCESRVPAGHPLRAILPVADTALAALSSEFQQLYALNGRPSIPPEIDRILLADLSNTCDVYDIPLWARQELRAEFWRSVDETV